MNKGEEYFKQKMKALWEGNFVYAEDFIKSVYQLREQGKEFVREDILRVLDACALLRITSTPRRPR